MKPRFDYTSVHSQNEDWANNPEYYSSQIREGASIDALAAAKQRLELYKQFDPNVLHNRTVAQVITINYLNNPRRERIGRSVVANFDLRREDEGLEDKIEIDLGKKIKEINDGNHQIEVPNCDVVYRAFDAEKKMASLQLRFHPCTYKRPVIYLVMDYVAIDDVIIQIDRKIHRPAFDKETLTFNKYFRNADNTFVKS